MLLQFKVENFLSFKDQVTFDMLASPKLSNDDSRLIYKCEDGVEVLKYGAIFGPNGTGKTNFVKAIQYSKSIVEYTVKATCNEEIFRCSDQLNYITKFEYFILIEGTYYRYGFHINTKTKSICKEYLNTVISDSEYENIFTRTDNTIVNNYKLEEKQEDRMNVYIDDMNNQSSTLFLKMMSSKTVDENPFTIYRKIFSWFTNKLIIIYPNTDYSNGRHYFMNEYKNERLKLYDALGLGISDYSKVELTEETLNGLLSEDFFQQLKEDILEKIQNQIQPRELPDDYIGFLNNGTTEIAISYDEDNSKLLFNALKYLKGKYEFDYEEQSDGTIRVIQLSKMFLDTDNKTYIIDEIDRSLHPSLTTAIVERLLEKNSNQSNQYIITTHETELLNSVKYRRDCFWFSDLDSSMSTTLTSLDQFKTRNDLKLNKAYLEGRFGALPFIKEYTED